MKSSAWKTTGVWLCLFVVFTLFIVANKGWGVFLNYFLLGLPQGAIIAAIAVGYSMVYGIIQLINFAHGEVFMFSAYFLLMFLIPPDSPHSVAPRIITAIVGLIIAVAVYSALGERRSPRWRGLIALVIACVVAIANYRLLPAWGGKPVIPFFAAYGLAIVYACCLGVTMDRLAYRPLRSSPRLIPLITAIGLSLLLQNVAQVTWGSASRFFPASATPTFFSGQRLALATVGDTRLELSVLDALIILVAVLSMAILQTFVLRTRMGKAMRACAQDRVTASLMGIRVDTVVALAFAIGAGLAGLVAPLYVLRGTPLYPQMGYIVGILAFASAVLGGIGNLTGAMIGGMIIGIIYSFVPLFDAFDTFPIFHTLEEWGWVTSSGFQQFVAAFGRPSQYQLGVAYAFMILVIVFKPTGLLGKAAAKRA
ncbi:MAG: branched-chain amino acid ABC transporter permease [Candidatus Sumerlaeaceae bacterium]|nr:branched-chain amino acid ABC transporter permease [Candidatus Sumerlaeaceae bacterium]